ncbi:MAG: hypothetical protein KC442_21420, partial [Thermomicrobiales bacterium]|nr:hypothetical protein [Thermomicrobiales bacterium]
TRTGDTLVVPDLSWTQLAPGDRLTGAVVFTVPASAQLTGLFTSPTGEQLVPLAALDGAQAPADTTQESTPDVITAEATATPEPAPAVVTPTPEVTTNPCQQTQDWLLAGTDRILNAQSLADEARNATDAATLADLSTQFAQMADDEALVTVPAGGEAAAKATVATLRALSSTTADAATAIEAGEDPAAALALVGRAQDRLAAIQAEMARVTGACVSAEAA